MNLIIAIIGSIVAIFSVIILHELGHYTMARIFGIKILRFSIGFGKALWKRVGKDGTEYIFAILPLGGYVKMLGEGEEVTEPQDMARAYNKKPLLVRMAVVFAGPLVNFIIAVVVFWAVYLMGVEHVKPVIGQVIPHSIAARGGLQAGDQLLTVDGKQAYNWQQVMMGLVAHIGSKQNMVLTIKSPSQNLPQQRILVLDNWKVDQRNPDFFGSVGIVPYEPKIPPIIAKVMPNSPAAFAGLEPQDRVVAMNGQAVDDWNVLVTDLQHRPGQKIQLTVLRKQHSMIIPLTIGVKKQGNRHIGYLGVLSLPAQWPANFIQTEKYSVFGAWGPALKQAWGMTKFNFVVLGKMITGKVSIHTLGGPVTVFQAAGEATLAGWQVYSLLA